ncbi:uncharacterized protein LOC144143447 [Haemaphysalis longicornis]
MLAYVKYDDNFKCILPVHLVKGFAPKGEEDFDPSKKIQAFWISEDRKVEGFYPGFVHALADSLVSMRTKIQSMREPFPRILQAEVPKMSKKKAPIVLLEHVFVSACIHCVHVHIYSIIAEDDDIIPADQLPAEMAEECEVADWNDAVIPGGQLPAATAEQQKAVGVPATSARPVPPATVARPQWQRVVPPGPVVSTFLVADGQVQIGPELTMPEPKWHWILRGTTDGKFTLDLARHLWSQEEAAERSLTGQACRSMTGAAQKVTASPVKVEVVKNCLAKYVELHPLPEPPADVRVKNARKYLRNFFTEAGRQGKRVRLPKNAQKN